MKDMIKFFFENGLFFIQAKLNGFGQIAYRLYKDGVVVEKIGYIDEKDAPGFKTLASIGNWRVLLYIKTAKGIEKKWSNEVSIKKSEMVFIDAFDGDYLDDRFYEIRRFKDLEAEIKRYKREGFMAMGREDLKAHKFSFPIDWLADPYDDRNWMYQLQAWRMIDPFLLRFEPQDVSYISQVINDWDAAVSTVDQVGDWFWYDMAVGIRALKLTYFVLRCKALRISHKINNLESLIERHICNLSNPNNLNYGNHGLFQVHGLMSLACLVKKADWLNLQGVRDYAVSSMELLLKNQLGEYGVHTENSPEYHFFVLKKIVSLINAPWWKGIEKSKIDKIIDQGDLAKHWLVTPSLECVPVGDSGTATKLANNRLIYNWDHNSNGRYISALLDGYVVVRSKPTVELDKSSFLFFQGSFHSGVHKHSDCLSFVWQEKGKYLLIDSGKYGYKSDRFRAYFTSGYAHNTLVVDEKSSSRSPKDMYGSGFADKPIYCSGYWISKGTVNHKRDSYIHTRVILFKPSVEVYVIDFICNYSDSKQSRKIELSWNLDPRFNIDSSKKSVFARSFDGVDTVSIKSVDEVGDLNFKCNYGFDDGKKLLGWASPSYLSTQPVVNSIFESYVNKKKIIVTKILANSPVDSSLADIVGFREGGFYCSNDEISSEIGFDRKKLTFFEPKFARHYDGLKYFVFDGLSHSFKDNNSHSLFVSFHGAIKPPTSNDAGTALPVFRLSNLSFVGAPSVLCFSDMLLEFYRDSSVYLGWFLDTKKVSQRDLIEYVVSYYVKKYSIKNILFYGSSGGGHVALDMAARFNQTAMVSNCQFDPRKHSQFSDLEKAVSANDDEFEDFSLLSMFNAVPGPKECLSYCNLDDYTISHHTMMEAILEAKFPNVLKRIHFSGNDVAQKKSIRNHSVGFPNGLDAKTAIRKYYQDAELTV